MAVQLTGKDIINLVQCPQLSNNTNLVVQRDGSSRAEKTQISKIIEMVTQDSQFKTSVLTFTNSSAREIVSNHKQESDPHGDRAFTTNLVNKHTEATDPHGDRGYSDSKLNVHINGSDPHGDRLYSNNLMTSHINADDPHKSNKYTNDRISDHKSEVDPHGDRAYTLSTLTNHTNSNDPHGDRAFTNSVINAHKAESDPHGLITKINQFISNHNNDIYAHGLNSKLDSISKQVTTDIESSLAQKVGISLAPLEYGKVPISYLKKFVVIDSFSGFPVVGETGILYVDKDNKNLYIWNNRYTLLSGNSSGVSGSITTDNIEQGTNKDKRFFTTELEKVLNSKISSAMSTEGQSLIKSTDNSNLVLKGITTEGILKIKNTSDNLIFHTDDYEFSGKSDATLRLSTDSEILKDIADNETVRISGYIHAYEYSESGGVRLLDNYNDWKVDGLLAIQGLSTSIDKPSNIVIASNGLVVTGKALPTVTVEVYDLSNNLLGSGVSIQDGTFTIPLSRSVDDGAELKAFSLTSDGNRSKPSYFFSPNKQDVKPLDTLTISPDGLKVRGNTSRDSTITIKSNTNVILGTAIADSNGNFTVTCSSALKQNDVISITATLGSLIYSVSNMTVDLPNIQGVYDIIINRDRTILTGKCEPLSLITFTLNGREYKAGSDADGYFDSYEFFNTFENGYMSFKVSQQTREETSVKTLTGSKEITETNPLVNNKLITANKMLYKSVIMTMGEKSTADLDLIYNETLNRIDVKGINKTGAVLKWGGTLNISRTVIGE